MVDKKGRLILLISFSFGIELLSSILTLDSCVKVDKPNH